MQTCSDQAFVRSGHHHSGNQCHVLNNLIFPHTITCHYIVCRCMQSSVLFPFISNLWVCRGTAWSESRMIAAIEGVLFLLNIYMKIIGWIASFSMNCLLLEMTTVYPFYFFKPFELSKNCSLFWKIHVSEDEQHECYKLFVCV